MSVELVLLSILYVHQTLDIFGVKGYVDRPAIISPDTIGWSILTVLFVFYNLGFSYVRLTLAVLFGLVVVGLYFFHWKLYWFGASEKKIAGYNRCFKNTHSILPKSETRVVPDTYHIIHTILYITNFAILVVNIFKFGL